MLAHALPQPLDKTVRTIEDAFAWSRRNAHCVGDSSLARLRCRLALLTLSTAFGGVCAPSTALHMIKAALGITAHLIYKFTIERASQCQSEMQCLPGVPATIYKDMTDFLTPESKDMLSKEEQPPSWDAVEIIVLHRFDSITTKATDIAGNETDVERTEVHVGGNPCVDFSSMGKCQGLNGPTNVALAVWIQLLRKVQFPIVVTECTRRFPLAVFEKYLPMYAISPCVLSNLMTGQCVQRVRLYTCMTWKAAVSLTRALDEIPQLFGRDSDASHTWANYTSAKDSELQIELQWSCSREASRSPGVLTPSTDGAFELALCPWEHRHLTLFREMCGPGLAYTLSQNATQRKTCATTEKLHCMTSSMHLLWNDVAKRWFTGRELFALQRFPRVSTDCGCRCWV